MGESVVIGQGTRLLAARPHSLTMRQSQVVHLVAAGLTNKEIGHLLGITQRGVAAHISRLLSAFSVTNRAQLVAHALVEKNGHGNEEPASEATPITPVLESQLLAYRDAPFAVVLTVGEPQTIWFVNRTAERALGMDYARAVGRSLPDLLSDPSAAWWIDQAARTLRTGLPRTTSATSTQLMRDVTSSPAADLMCVFQPVLNDTNAVVAVLSICMAA